MSSWLEFALVTMFNLSICILLPRLVTQNWGKLMQRMMINTNKSVSSQSSHFSTSAEAVVEKINR
ncbi:MAG: hypothetical protein ACLFQP_01660 [Halothece sp.]